MHERVHACNNKLNVEKKTGETSIGRLLMSFNEVTLNLKLAEELTFQTGLNFSRAKDTAQQRKKKKTCEELRRFLKQINVFFVHTDSTHF